MSVAGVVGRGFAAGAVGTVVLTVAEKAEMKLTGREPSTIPTVVRRLCGQRSAGPSGVALQSWRSTRSLIGP